MSSRKQKGEYDGKIAGLYDMEDTIGRGHFAVVKLARHVFTGEKVAVKVIDKSKLDEVSKAHLFQEVRCMKLVQHPNVVRLYEVIDTQTKLYLILELGDGGDMYDYIMKHEKGLSENVARKYFKQIVEAISYCHRLHVVHRDLKPENVVFFEKLGIVKLTDFGFSNMFNPGKKLETSCGSLAYSAPEILLGDSYDPPAVDVWSLGVILFMLVGGAPPFQEANDSETLTMIMDCKYHIPHHVTDNCKDLISKMLQRDPSHRLSLDQIVHHSWLLLDSTPIQPLPLISREQLPDDQHSHVIQKMVDGAIASKEEIMQSLERNAYDHIAATYYLLAERRLKRQESHKADKDGCQRKLSAPEGSSKPHLEPLALSPRIQTKDAEQKPDQRRPKPNFVQSLVSPPGTHPAPASSSSSPQHALSRSPERYSTVRKYSLIMEESFEDDEDLDDEGEPHVGYDLRPTKSAEDLDDVNKSTSQVSIEPPPLRRPLISVASSPQLLNQICEENESDEEDDIVPSKLSSPRLRLSRSGMASPEALKKYEQRKKRRAGQRGASCSSSDASDTDDTETRSRKDKLKHKFAHRRDSSDHSSDTDGGPNGGNFGGSNFRDSSSGNGGGGGGGSGSNRDRNNDRNDRGGKGKKNSKDGGQGSRHHHNLNKCDQGSKWITSMPSELSVISAVSSLSLNSITSKNSQKYIIDKENTLLINNAKQFDESDVERLNQLNSRLSEAKSKDFSDLSDYECTSTNRDLTHISLPKLTHRKGKSASQKLKLKMDINSNSFCKVENSVQMTQMKAGSKCCSLV